MRAAAGGHATGWDRTGVATSCPSAVHAVLEGLIGDGHGRDRRSPASVASSPAIEPCPVLPPDHIETEFARAMASEAFSAEKENLDLTHYLNAICCYFRYPTPDLPKMYTAGQ